MNVELDRDLDVINKNIMYLTDVIALDLFYISLNHCKSRGINVAAWIEATFIAPGTSVITPIKRRMGLLSSC